MRCDVDPYHADICQSESVLWGYQSETLVKALSPLLAINAASDIAELVGVRLDGEGLETETLGDDVNGPIIEAGNLEEVISHWRAVAHIIAPRMFFISCAP